jgi:3-methyl-2-oxobutanoate hydroxymethyltransferase
MMQSLEKDATVTIPSIKEKKEVKEKIVMITAYDYPSAKIADEAGVDIILVGDSLGMAVQGNEDTLSVSLDEMIYHTRIVSKGVKRAMVVSDMPFLSYHISLGESIKNCGKCIKEGKAKGVKIEGAQKRCDLIKTLVENDIPVMGHLGLTPQSIYRFGGYKVQGKDEFGREKLMEDALRLQDAGVFSIVLECIPLEVAKEITDKVSIPTIGIGAGPYCDGQVLVFHDLLGISEKPYPKFVKAYKNLREEIFDGIFLFAKEVRSGKFPSDDNSYHYSEKRAENDHFRKN